MPPRSKRLILCCDDSTTTTSFPPSSTSPSKHPPRPSNPARLARMLARHGHNHPGDDDDEDTDNGSAVPQIVYHLSTTTIAASDRSTDSAVAAAYLFLAANYAPGDAIAAFGAGRGAAVARTVVALVTEAGVLRAGEVGWWSQLWGLWKGWRRRENGGGGGGFWGDVLAYRSPEELSRIAGLKGSMWADVRVGVVGVWDTVDEGGSQCESLGGGEEEHGRRDFALNSRIDNAFQALALDEDRAAFRPSLWHLERTDVEKEGPKPRFKQCWFPGFHETVGGCAIDAADPKDSTDIADITLAWMCDQVDGLLTFDEIAVAEFLNADQGAQQYNSTTSLSADNSVARSLRETRTQANKASKENLNAMLITLLTRIVAFLNFLTRLLNGVTNTAAADKETSFSPHLSAIRSPGQYHKNLEFEKGTRPDDFETNESIHPSVKHRKDLFALARVPYSPAPLREWRFGGLDGKHWSPGRRGRWSCCCRNGPGLARQALPWMGGACTMAKEEDGQGANAINGASARLDALCIRKPHPEWRYREAEDGDGAAWVRPSVPRSSSFSTASSSSAAHSRGWPLWAWVLFGPVLVIYYGVAPVLGLGAESGRGLRWHYEREISLSEWVIREVPGRHNFEARLLPWLVREQLNRRNSKRLGWRSEESWARAPFPARESSDVVGREPCAQEPANEDTSLCVATGLTERARRSDGTGPGAVKKRGPLHVRKGSVAAVSAGGDSERAVGQSPRHAMRRSVSLTASPSTAVMRTEGVGRVGPEGSPSANWRSSGCSSGGGLKALIQQPVRREAAGKREAKEKERPAFSPGHRKSHSQTSVSWR